MGALLQSLQALSLRDVADPEHEYRSMCAFTSTTNGRQGLISRKIHKGKSLTQPHLGRSNAQTVPDSCPLLMSIPLDCCTDSASVASNTVGLSTIAASACHWFGELCTIATNSLPLVYSPLFV